MTSKKNAPCSADKIKLINEAIDKINKKFGEGSVALLDESARKYYDVMAVPSGIPTLDVALGSGGWPRGRMIELYGQEGGGKTAIAMHAVASFQREGLVAAFIDLEQSFDPALAEAYGINLDSLIISQPGSGEAAFDIAIALASAGIDLIVLDSIAALAPRAEIEGDMSDSHMALQARLVSKACRVLTPAANKDKASRTTMIFINQFREKVGLVFGDPRITPGGRALKHYASVRVEVTSGAKADQLLRNDSTLSGIPGLTDSQSEMDGATSKEQIGQVMRMKVTKNKVGCPEQTATARLLWGVGIDMADQAFQLGMTSGLLTYKGKTYQVADGDRFVGKPAMYAALREDEALQMSLVERSVAHLLGMELPLA